MLEIRYVGLEQLVEWDKNPKRHDLPGLTRSIRRYGFRDAPILDATLGAIVAGNGRASVLVAMRDRGEPPPDGVARASDGSWLVPVQVGMDASSIAEAEAFAVDHNNLTLTGGDLTLFELARLWEGDAYRDLLAGLASADALPVTVDGDDLDALLLTAQTDLAGRSDATAPDLRPTVTLRVISAALIETVAAAVRAMLAQHPEWGAEIAT